MWLTANTNVYIQPKMEKKCQAHNLKVVVSPPATNLFDKINNLYCPQKIQFFGFFCFKPDSDYRVINNVFNVIQTHK